MSQTSFCRKIFSTAVTLCLVLGIVHAQQPQKPPVLARGQGHVLSSKLLLTKGGYDLLANEINNRLSWTGYSHRKNNALIDIGRLPMHQSHDYFRQRLIKSFPQLLNRPAVSAVRQQVLPVQRPYSWYQQYFARKLELIERMRPHH